jgi:hypothetical protein
VVVRRGRAAGAAQRGTALARDVSRPGSDVDHDAVSGRSVSRTSATLRLNASTTDGIAIAHTTMMVNSILKRSPRTCSPDELLLVVSARVYQSLNPKYPGVSEILGFSEPPTAFSAQACGGCGGTRPRGVPVLRLAGAGCRHASDPGPSTGGRSGRAFPVGVTAIVGRDAPGPPV